MFRFMLVLWFAMLSGLAQGEARDVHKYFFDQKLGDFKSDLANAKKEGKRGILLMFEQEDCPWCYRMKTTILNQSEVQDYFKKHFQIYHMDIKGDVTMVDFKGRETTEKKYSEENRVRATPVFGFIDLEGNMVFRFTGVAKDVNEFLLVGRYVVEGAYKTQSFPVYKQHAK
ncbi:MAG: thioredoxin fold domain-containing protein [Hydrogenophilales bacterium]|nr:thioredoxin fold domain-containing protein [Hydrogenophilales bacterium]